MSFHVVPRNAHTETHTFIVIYSYSYNCYIITHAQYHYICLWWSHDSLLTYSILSSCPFSIMYHDLSWTCFSEDVGQGLSQAWQMLQQPLALLKKLRKFVSRSYGQWPFQYLHFRILKFPLIWLLFTRGFFEKMDAHLKSIRQSWWSLLDLPCHFDGAVSVAGLLRPWLVLVLRLGTNLWLLFEGEITKFERYV